MLTSTLPCGSSIILTEWDFDRLTELTHSPRYRATHAALLSGLKQELDRGEVVSPQKVSRNVVTMHSKLRVRDLKGYESGTYTLVYPDEASINEGKISVLAPLGMALLGARVGQTVAVSVPAGMRRLKIERILYQPEAMGDYHL